MHVPYYTGIHAYTHTYTRLIYVPGYTGTAAARSGIARAWKSPETR